MYCMRHAKGMLPKNEVCISGSGVPRIFLLGDYTIFLFFVYEMLIQSIFVCNINAFTIVLNLAFELN